MLRRTEVGRQNTPKTPFKHRFSDLNKSIQAVDVCRIDCFVIIRFAAGLAMDGPAASTGRKDE